MAETSPLEPDPVVIPGQDPAAPAAPDEAPSWEPSPEIAPDGAPVEQPEAPFPDDESGRPIA